MTSRQKKGMQVIQYILNSKVSDSDFTNFLRKLKHLTLTKSAINFMACKVGLFKYSKCTSFQLIITIRSKASRVPSGPELLHSVHVDVKRLTLEKSGGVILYHMEDTPLKPFFPS